MGNSRPRLGTRAGCCCLVKGAVRHCWLSELCRRFSAGAVVHACAGARMACVHGCVCMDLYACVHVGIPYAECVLDTARVTWPVCHGWAHQAGPEPAPGALHACMPNANWRHHLRVCMPNATWRRHGEARHTPSLSPFPLLFLPAAASQDYQGSTHVWRGFYLNSFR